MQFKVPQFLEIEDTFFGRYTFREFVYLAGGAGACFILYRLLGFVFGIIPILAVAGFALTLTFYHPNNKPFINMLESGFSYIFKSKLYIWKRRKNKITTKQQNEMTAQENTGSREGVIRLGGNKLRDLAWSLDVLDLSKHENN